jgi:hypothetical protein
MKKKILFILVLVLTSAGGAFLYFNISRTPLGAEYYADYLPKDTLVTLSLLDLNGLSDSFPATSLGRFLAKPTMHGIMEELGANAQGLQSYDNLYDGLAGILTNPAFRQVFGDDAVTAVLTPDPSRLKVDQEKEMQRSVMVFGTSSVAGPIDSFARMVMSKDFTNETVDGLKMTRIQLDENEVMYGYSEEGVIILAYDSSTIVSAVQRKQGQDSLQNNPVFTAGKAFWSSLSQGRMYCRIFVNLAQLRTLLTNSGTPADRQTAEYLQGVNSLSTVIIGQQDELQVLSSLDYDFDSLDPLFKEQLQAGVQENTSLGLLTSSTLAYYWASSLDNDFINGILSAADQKSYDRIDSELQKELGLSLEQLLAALGPQAGVTVNDIVNVGLFPLPKVIFFLQVQDRAVVQQVLDRLREKIGERGFVKENSEMVNEQTIYYWTMLPGEATHPALVLTEDMLYIANGESVLKKLLSSDQSTRELSADMRTVMGKEMSAKVQASNYTSFVMRPALLADKVKDAADWLAGMYAAGVPTDKLRQEVFTLMQSISVVSATGDVQKDHTLSALVFKLAEDLKQEKE